MKPHHFIIDHLLPPGGLANTSLHIKFSYKLGFPVVSSFFPLSHFSQPLYRAHRVCAASQHENIFTFLNSSESMQPLFSNFLPKLHSTLQQPNQMATNSPNVLLMFGNRPPILDTTYRVFSVIYGWTCSCSFYSLDLLGLHFSRCFLPLFTV